MTSPYRSGEDTTPYQLGALRSAHAERSGCLLRFIVGAFGAYVVVAAFFLGLPASSAVKMLIVIACSALLLWWIGRRNPRRLIQLYVRGITSEKRGRPRVIRFDDVARIVSSQQRRGLAGAETQHHIVEAKDGTRIAFSLLFDGAPDLLAAVHHATQRRLLAETQKILDAGDVARFGPIAISKDGFFDRDQPVLGWDEFERAAIEMPPPASGLVWSEVKLWKRGASEPIAKYPLEQVPNVNVMLAAVALFSFGDASVDD